MSPWVLEVVLMVAQVEVPMPKEKAPQVQVVGQREGKSQAKKDCYPWFPERNYQCPDPRESQK